MYRTLLILLGILLFPNCAGAASDNVVVVSCTQDYDVARLVAESLSATHVVTRWGRLSEDDVFEIKKQNPDRMIIIGGRFAVPQKAEELGIPFERVGGEDRIETARLALKRFFNFEAKRSYVLPSAEDLKSFFENPSDSEVLVFIGNSSVSKRWGRYYAAKIQDYYPEVYVLEGNTAYISPDSITVVVGNKDNNPTVRRLWYLTGLPQEASVFPLIYLKDDILFISGSDQNIFYNQRAFENLGLKKYGPKEMTILALLLMFLLAFLSRFEKRRRTLLFVSCAILAYVFLHLYLIPKRGQLVWDSLYVYFDGALSLKYSGIYETIVGERSLPGTSFLTYLYFLLVPPTDTNANLLNLFLSAWVIVASYIVTIRLIGNRAGLAVFLLLLFNPLFHEHTLLYSSDIPFTALTLAAVVPLAAGGRYSPLVSAVFLGLSMLVRPSAVLLLIPLMLHYRSPKKAGALLLSIPIFLMGIHQVGGVSGYLSEVEVKSSVLATHALPYIKNLFLSTNLIMAPFLLMGLYKPREIFSQYVILHMIALSLWVAYDVRYLLPIIPFVAIIQGKSLFSVKGRFPVFLLLLALLLNLIQLKQFYVP